EAQRAYFSLPTEAADNYDELKKEILGRLGLSSISAAQLFHDSPGSLNTGYWREHPRLVRSAAPSSPTVHQAGGGDDEPNHVESIVLAEAAMHRDPGERAPSFPRRVVQEQRTSEGTQRTQYTGLRLPAQTLHPLHTHHWLAASYIESLPVEPHEQNTPGFGNRQPHFIVKNGLLCCERASRGAEGKSGDGNGARSRPSNGRSPQSHEYHPAHPTGWRRKAILPSLPDMSKDRATSPSPQPTHSASHNRGTLRANWNGPGHEHILVIVDYATRYPEAIPLRKATAKNIAKELFLLCTRVGIPAEILTDQGTPFMSRLMADLCRLLRVKQICTTVFHPQTDGLVERFNQTLKQMLKRVAAEDRKDWDLMLPYVLFGVREVPQASTGFTPFELLFGRQPRGLLDVAREAWEQQQPAPLRSAIEHVREMRERIERVMPLVREHVTKAQQSQQRIYNRAAQPREFQPGDRVMVLVPTSACKFLATWQGPYTVTERVGPVTYQLRQPGRWREEQLYHINLLKKWVGTREQLTALASVVPVVIDMGDHLQSVLRCGPGSSQPSISQKDIGKFPSQLLQKTAFSTPSGHWQYRTLPFGLHGAPAMFQRMMDIILSPHQSYATAYWTDRQPPEIAVPGVSDWKRADSTSTEKVTKTQVQAFLGLAGYYCCFIPNFSTLASPLTDLTRKGQPEKIVWNDALNKTFQDIKTALTTKPVLRAPDFNCPFLLQTDTSDTGLGVVLSQVRDGEEHPVTYISHKLTPAETRYAAVEKEALAIKWAVLELRYYLLGRRFTLITDHAPLQWMARTKDTKGGVALETNENLLETLSADRAVTAAAHYRHP
ncbi:hypothetical protein M9458_008707, partial [Cirrhinus mrigala]